MGYLHISNLYKDQNILLFKECYALEKIHGTSAHISCTQEGLKFFAGGANHELFLTLFDKEHLQTQFAEMFGHQLLDKKITVFGEAYGGKLQRMKDTYGPDLKFVAFDVQVGDSWLVVPHAEKVVQKLGLEFVHYEKISTSLEEIDRVRDEESIQAIRNGLGHGKMREGVVLRPLLELTKNNGERIIAKHKGEKFSETATSRPVDNPDKLKALAEGDAVAIEWATPMRLEHVLDKIENKAMENMKNIIAAMLEDIRREGEGEIVWSEAAIKAIGKRTAGLVKAYHQMKMEE